ncbi:MAG: Uma2 family endonuclease [Xenococcus sp. (in: cyanobacteria)]
MFTDLLNLPIDSDRAQAQDQILSLSGMSWSDYEKLTSQDYLGYRISYLNGVITIVSPSRSHERIAEIINGLIKTYCRKYNRVYFPMGSTTLKNPPLAGKEPDHSFAFDTDKSIPDLAVEVTYSSGGVADLEKYKYFGVKEVWFWKNNEITFYHLVNSEYQEIENSVCLSKLSADFLITFINRGLTETPLTIEDDFYQQLN